jgi:hypothetical protein
VFDFAGALWSLQTKGREFLELRARLAHELVGAQASVPPGRGVGFAEIASPLWQERQRRRGAVITNQRGDR